MYDIARIWYAVYVDEMEPTAVFVDLGQAKLFALRDRKSIIRKVKVDAGIGDRQGIIFTLFADFDPRVSNA